MASDLISAIHAAQALKQQVEMMAAERVEGARRILKYSMTDRRRPQPQVSRDEAILNDWADIIVQFFKGRRGYWYSSLQLSLALADRQNVSAGGIRTMLEQMKQRKHSHWDGRHWGQR